jgi:hypothetical protein
MTEFMIAAGWDADPGDLNPLSDAALRIKPPRQERIEPGRRTTLMDSSVAINGGWQTAIIFDEYITTARWADLLTSCGLASAESAQVTVLAFDRDRVWGYWNAIITRPVQLPAFYNGRFQGKVVFPLSLIEYLGAPA